MIDSMLKKIDEDKLRKVAGAFATGIAVASVMDEAEELIGMTVNSFLSVSLDPPILLFSAGKESRLLKHCEPGKKLSLNILSADQKNLSDYFAGLPVEINKSAFEREAEFIRFPGAMAWYKTSIRETVEAGDHHLILLDIIDCERNDNSEPLVFYKGYRTVSHTIKE